LVNKRPLYKFKKRDGEFIGTGKCRYVNREFDFWKSKVGPFKFSDDNTYGTLNCFACKEEVDRLLNERQARQARG